MNDDNSSPDASFRVPSPGEVGWIDLTVEPEITERVRDFYATVVDWQVESVDMGGYSDFCMTKPGKGPVAGVCHRRDSNTDLPPVWIVYFVVDDLEAAMQRCRNEGGEVVRAPGKPSAAGRFAVIRDPAGALSALWSKS